MATTVSKAFLLAVALGAINATAQAVVRRDEASDLKALIAELKVEPTHLDRFHDILNSDGQTLLNGQALADVTVFDFNTAYPVPGVEGGTVSSASVRNFPLLLGSGLTWNLATIGPCGIFFPHVHPHADEFFFVIDGELGFGYMLEQAPFPDPKAAPPLPQIDGTLKKFTGTLFLQGSVRWQSNHQCEGATIVAALGSEDPGTTPVLQKVATSANVTGMLRKGKRQADGEELEMFFSGAAAGAC